MPKIKSPATCIASGDPHYTTFSNQRFDYYKLGDFLLFESNSFTAHTRLKKWGGVSVNTGVAVKINKAGQTVETITGNCAELLINGKKLVTLKAGQKKYFKYGGYVKAYSATKIKIVSSSGDYLEVESNLVNTAGNSQLQDHYFNIAVRVQNKHKYYSGFCVNKVAQHVHGLFRSEYKAGKEVVHKKCSVKKRKHFERKCVDNGITERAGLLRCIIDGCYNMKPMEEIKRELLREQSKKDKPKHGNKVRTPRPIRQNLATCYSLGDPHYQTFNNKHFNNYWVGDFILVSGKDFTVHARTRKWNAAAVNKRIAANLNGDIIEAKSADKFTLNRDTQVDLKVGQEFKLPKGGLVKRISNNRCMYYSFEQGYLDAEFMGTGSMRYVNLIVKVPNWQSTQGACNGNMISAHGLFIHHLKMRQSKREMVVSKRCHHTARLKCMERSIPKRYLGSCIIDVCANLGTKALRRGLRIFKQDRVIKHRKHRRHRKHRF